MSNYQNFLFKSLIVSYLYNEYNTTNSINLWDQFFNIFLLVSLLRWKNNNKK